MEGLFKGILFLFLAGLVRVEGITVFAPLNSQGIRGTVTFVQEEPGAKVTALVSIETLWVDPTEYSWAVHEFPVDYGANPASRCDRTVLGSPLLKLDEVFGKLTLPTESTVILSSDRFNLTGTDGIWSHSLVLTNRGQATCATIDAEGDRRFGVAHFSRPMAGRVYFQTLNDRQGITTSIFSDLFHVNQDRPAASDHNWKLYITEYTSAIKDEVDCNAIQQLWDPDNRGGGSCGKGREEECAVGEMGGKHGKIRVGARQSIYSRILFKDSTLPPIPYGGRRKIVLVIFHPDRPDTIVGCALIKKIEPKRGVALLAGHGAKMNFTFVQKSPFHPTTTHITGRGLKERAANFHVHVFPKTPKMKGGEGSCGRTGGHWNPYQVNMADYPQPAGGSDDQFELGDMSGKYGTLAGLDNVTSTYTDQNLPLFGPQTILGRSIVIHKDEGGGRWMCGNIENTQPLLVAMARFKYPLVGSIYFIQEAHNPNADTSIFIDGLHYSDGSRNNTLDHQWGIHSGEINKDYYDWRNRCTSAGPHFNPYRVSTESRGYSDCGPSSPFRCELGDLSTRLQRLTVSGTKIGIVHTRRFFTDTNLPLSGRHGVIGKSVVITDDIHPVHRGDRLACVKIQRLYRVKAVAKDWFGNGEKTGVTGRLEFIQETPFSPIKTFVGLKGLGGVVANYHVHSTSIPIDRSQPCSDHAVGGHFNPFNISTKTVVKGGTPDQYEVGDLSGKFDKLRALNEFEREYNDTNMQLGAPHSILGRSVVLHKRDRNIRYACADVVRGYSPSEAAEYRAIASFHHPEGYVWGYVRFTQLVYNDGSLSDTVIEVNLKYPGQINRNATRGHGWSVFVNRVGHDASVRSLQHRCSAAGYRWNPYFVHLADPNNVEFYGQECSPETPLRCDVGDISGRLGPISVGENKFVLIDPNLPLSGAASVLGRSLIIHAPKGATERQSCANIDPDKDIIKYANIRKLNNFLIEEFILEVRRTLGVPEWMLTYDNRQTKDVYSAECIQILFHFRGPVADRIEQDFDRLLNGREIGRPSLDVPGVLNPAPRKTSLPYRTCSHRKPSQQLTNSLGIPHSVPKFGSGGNRKSLPSYLLVGVVLISGLLRQMQSYN